MSDCNYNEEIDEATPDTVADWLVNVTSGDQLSCSGTRGKVQDESASCLTTLDVNFSYSTANFSRVREFCCPACQAHWFAQMARNAIDEHKRSR